MCSVKVYPSAAYRPFRLHINIVKRSGNLGGKGGGEISIEQDRIYQEERSRELARRDLEAEKTAKKARRQAWLELAKSLLLVAVLLYLYFVLRPIYMY